MKMSPGEEKVMTCLCRRVCQEIGLHLLEMKTYNIVYNR